MKNPVRTGCLFGLGFSLVFIVITIALSFTEDYIVDSLVSQSLTDEAEFGEPVVEKTDAVFRENKLMVLVTVSNPTDKSIRFYSEAVLFDDEGVFLDTCGTEREYVVKPDEKHRFKALCPNYGVEQQEVYRNIGEVKLQFFEEY